ncbi:hypothetical protein [Natrinema salsiterrestre]|uniref:DUF8159 domain-containing protein n=1 Tax=Natrinema salsiterrestre TaxID=2950540 RepID=A0A9Q4Q496_9EURY|nr:hypothetical protein [Natrinema salsiterrestre]MDF9747122.1 hypothetical protein [Natrinema salsiterrestre]
MTDEGPETGSEADVDDGTDAGERPVGVALENRLMSHGYYVTSFTWMDDVAAETTADESAAETDPHGRTPEDGAGIELEYEAVTDAPGVTSNEVGAVLRTLLEVGEEREWTPGRLEVTSVTTDGDVRGWWYVEREWFDRLGDDLSQVEFSERVLTTVKHHQSE